MSFYRHHLWRMRLALHPASALRHVTLMLTNMCDYHCPMCESSSGKKLRNELTTVEVLNLLNELKEMHVKSVTLIGGEVLLRRDIFEIIQRCNELDFFLELGTNCSRVRELRSQFKAVRINSLLSSIDGLPATNNPFRGNPQAFERTIEAIEFFKSRGAYPILINTVVHPGNLHELESCGEILAQAGVDIWRLTPVLPVGRAKTQFTLLGDDAHLIKLLAFVKENRYRFRTVISEELGFVPHFNEWFYTQSYFYDSGLRSCAINPEGYVTGDLMLYDSRYYEGNIREQSFAQIWKRGFDSYRNAALPEKCRGCPWRRPCYGGNQAIRSEKRDCLRRIFPVIESWNRSPAMPRQTIQIHTSA